jgi:hypothetical protein
MGSKSIAVLSGRKDGKVPSVLLREARRKLKIQQLKKAARSTERKSLQSNCIFEEESYK